MTIQKSILHSACAVFVVSDWHVEERVLPSHVNGLNEYGPDVARKRAERFVEGCLWLLDTHRGGAKIETAVLALLGDFITGWIHEEYQAGNALAPTEATEFAHDLLRDCIEAILKRARLKALRIVCTRGNHGRITKRTYINPAARLSFEWLMYRMLAKHYDRDSRVQIAVEAGYHTYLPVFVELRLPPVPPHDITQLSGTLTDDVMSGSYRTSRGKSGAFQLSYKPTR